MTTKFHEVWHVIWFARYLSPRMSWCYAFEDFIGKIKRSAQACVCGTPMHNIPGKVMDNYIRALSLELKNGYEQSSHSCLLSGTKYSKLLIFFIFI